MHETEHLGMQTMTWNLVETVIDKLAIFRECRAFENPVASIQSVVEQRMSGILHMHTDLVGSSRLQSALHQGDVVKAFQHFTTSENLARFIFQRLKPAVNLPGVRLSRVRVCESPSSGASYFE